MDDIHKTSNEKVHVLSVSSAPSHHVHHAVMTHVGGIEYDKTRRRSTIHSYTLSNYHALSHDPQTMRAVHEMTRAKAYKNVIALGLAFMFVFTAFVSIQGLQSTMNWEGGVGVTSLSSIYVTTIISCLLAPWIIQKLTTKWTMIIAFVLCTGYFAGNFHPEHYMLVPLGALLGLLGGPLWSAQATSITSISLAYSEHIHAEEQEIVVNKMMGIFCGLYRTSNIWGNLITTLVLGKNETLHVPQYHNFSTNSTCGAGYCLTVEDELNHGIYFSQNAMRTISSKTKIMLLSIYLGCGMMGIVILISLFDQHKNSKLKCRDDVLSSKETFLATIKMFKDTKCLLLLVIVVFIGLEQGFMFSDFTKAYISCTLGVTSIGPVMICFGAVSSVSCILIGCIASRHIKRFAFISAGATFNIGLLIVLWLWKPSTLDIPNFFVVAACLGLCDAIWQTQTYTLFGIIFMHKQEAAFASYRMFYATGCAIAYGYSYFLCVETKVLILAVVLIIGLICYCVIEMKVQLQSQHIKDIVAL